MHSISFNWANSEHLLSSRRFDKSERTVYTLVKEGKLLLLVVINRYQQKKDKDLKKQKKTRAASALVSLLGALGKKKADFIFPFVSSEA